MRIQPRAKMARRRIRRTSARISRPPITLALIRPRRIPRHGPIATTLQSGLRSSPTILRIAVTLRPRLRSGLRLALRSTLPAIRRRTRRRVMRR